MTLTASWRSFSSISWRIAHWDLKVCSSSSRACARSWPVFSFWSRSRRWCSSCSSSSPTRAARLSRNARCAALFWAFRFVGGVSVAGLRPGFGRGGMTHSLLVMDAALDGVIGDGVEAAFAAEGGGIGMATMLVNGW